MADTAQSIIYRALRRIGALRPGYQASPELLQDALDEWRSMYDGWNTDQTFQFTNPDQYFAINNSGFMGNSYQYTIGGSGSGADLICTTLAKRPASIRRANWVWVINTPTQPQRLPIRIIDEAEWMRIIQLPIPGALLAIYMWYDPQYPLGVINLWPPVQPGNQLEFYMWGQLQWPASLSTTFDMPEGYLDATVYSLAERLIALAPRFEITKMNPDISRLPALALEKRNMIRNVNRTTPRLISDMNRAGSTYFFMVGDSSDYE